MTTKEEKIEIVQQQLKDAQKLASLAERANLKPQLNKAKRLIKQKKNDLVRLSDTNLGE